MLKSRHIASLFNVSLRLANLVGKLCLSLYMGKYFLLEDIGIYGLIFGIIMMGVAFLGFRMDYVVSRSLVTASPLEALCRMRDQSIFYFINYGATIVIAMVFAVAVKSGLSNKFIIYGVVLLILESYGNLCYNNMNSLSRPMTASILFFIRSSLWIAPLIGVWILFPALRTVDTILISWTAGAAISVVANLILLKALPWAELPKIAIDWPRIYSDVLKSVPIWVGALGLSAGAYVDRFVVAHFLGLKEAGIAAFYFSFTYSLLTLIQSGVLTIAYPKLIRFNSEGNSAAFWQESREVGISVAVFSAVISIGIGTAVPLLGHFIGRQELVSEAPTLWLMLVGIFIRSVAETLYYILFARHQDRPIWLGNLLFLIPAFGFNLLLVPWLGIIGIGFGGILAAIMLLLWRMWFVIKPGNTIPLKHRVVGAAV
jgi:O-antigen/teichoic acid export membrane protein